MIEPGIEATAVTVTKSTVSNRSNRTCSRHPATRASMSNQVRASAGSGTAVFLLFQKRLDFASFVRNLPTRNTQHGAAPTVPAARVQPCTHITNDSVT